MDVLVGNFILCIIFAIIIYMLPLDYNRKNIYYSFITIVLISFVHGFIDVYSVPDLYIYEDVFHDVDEKSVFEVLFEPGGDDGSDYERGFKLYQKFFSTFFSDFNIFLVINSFVMFGLYYKSFYRYSPYIFFSVLLLLLIPYNQSLFVIRQHLSIAVLTLSYPYIINQDIRKFLVVLFSAYLIHNSSLIFLPVYFLYGIKDTHRYLIAMTIGTLMVSFLFMTIVVVLGSIFTRNTFFIDNIERGVATKSLIMGAVMACYCYVLRDHVLEPGINKLVFTISLIGIVGNALVGESGGGRIFWSYYIVMLLQIPLTMYYIQNRVFKGLYLVSVLSLFTLFSYVLAGDVVFYLALSFII